MPKKACPGHRAKSRGRGGFTLIEILIATAIVGLLLGFSYFSYPGYIESVRLNAAAGQIASDLRSLQNKAQSEHKTYSITINNKTFEFSPSGGCPPGGSGTLILSGKKHSKKIIVAPNGRVRIE